MTAGTLRLLDDEGTVVDRTYSAQGGIVNFTPAGPLQPETVYTVLVVANGVTDYAGNASDAGFRSTFVTGGAATIAAKGFAAAVSSATLQEHSTVGEESLFEAVRQSDATYRWSFGDGVRSGATTQRRVTHSYAAPGHYTVVLTISVGGAERNYSFVRTASSARTALAPTASAAIVGHGDLVFNVNPDNGSVTAIHRERLNRVWETRVGRGPRTLAVNAAGEVWVAVQEEDKLVRLDRTGRYGRKSMSDTGGAPTEWPSRPARMPAMRRSRVRARC